MKNFTFGSSYIPSTGKYDAMSLGKIHWAGNKNGQDRGLDYLLQDADYSGYKNRYNYDF